jgi:hypothetical protein
MRLNVLRSCGNESWWMAEEIILLCEASSEVRRGRGRVALTISEGFKNPLERRLGAGTVVAGSNGMLKGRAVRVLCERSREEREGSEKKRDGREVSALCDRSRLIREVRSAKLSGSEVRRLF